MERLLLRKIRLQGFKSYGEEKTIDGFDENLTCICGPNGSGKSSLVEAISFVLQSRLTKKELQQLQNDTKGCQQAMSVSLYFEKQGANGSQHLLIEKEVKNGKYNCYVNENLESWDGPKRQLKMNEAVKFVKKFGLDIQFPERFIVFQMRTIEVAGKTPEKLLHFLEKIIGTSQLRQNIEAQKEMLSELRMNCAQNEENIGSLQKKRELLEPKVNQFERYVQEKESFSKALLEFLKEKTFYKLSRTVDVTRRAGDLTQQHKEISSKLKMKQKKLFFQEKRTKEAEAAVAASALDEKNVSKVLQKANLANGRLESQKTSLQSAWQLLENQFETFRKTVDQANERISVLKEDLSSLRCKGGKASCLTPEQTKKIEAFQTKAAVSRKSLRTAEQEHSSLQNTYSAICKEFEKKISSFEAQNGTIREESQMTSKQRTQLDSSSKSIEIRIQKLQEERSMLQQRLDSARETVASHQQKLRAVTKSLEFFLLASGTARAEKAVDFLKSKRRDIYGFLCSLAIVPGPAQMAVNQVLFPLLPKVIVVENRSAANVVINYFKEHKIGIVQCEILSELPAPSSTPIPQDGLTPLLDVFQYSAKKFEKVFWKFTQSWWLAESSSSAIGLSYENYGGCVTRRNIVSLDGTVAYSWGSVLRNLKRINKISSHVMKDSFPETLPYQEENSQKRSDLEHCVANGEASLESSASDVRKLSQDIQKIDREIEDLGAEASDLSEKFQRESRIRSEFQRRIEMINSEIEKLVKAHEKQKAKLEDLISRSQSKLEEIKKTDEIREATDCKELGEEVLEHYLVRQEIHQVEEQLQKEELISSMTSESMSPVEIELSKKRKQIEKIMLELKVQQKLTEKLKKKREEAKGRLREALRERDQQQKRLSAKEDTISDLQTAISSLRKKRAKIDVDLEGLRFSVQESASQYKSELRKVARDPALSESPTEPRSCDELSDDEMDIEEENDETPDSLPLLLDADVLAPGLCDEFEVWKGNYEKDPGMAIKKLEGESEEMKHKRLRLLALKDQVDLPALAENSKLEENVSCCMEYVEKTKQEIQSLSSKILSLETERFNRFSNAITSLNESLSTTYYHLNPYGDCSLHFNPHRELIFDGVWLKVRPDRVWKDFHSLSGGQKALAALALSLAFQQQYPSPLYVFDEVDASLDIVAVERLAKFIIQHSSESSSQFIVVSLRPEFFQWAPVLVGTHFTSSGVSNSIVFRPRRTDEEEEEML